MLGQILGSIIGGFSQIGTNRMNQNIANSRNSLENSWFNRSMNFEREMFDAENDWNLQQWERQNTYNEAMRDEQRQYDSPEAQRQRLINAGINPLTASYGDGFQPIQSSPLSGASGGSVGVPNAEMANITNPFEMSMEGLGNFLDAKLKEKGIEGAELDNQFKQFQVDNQPQAFATEQALKQSITDYNVKLAQKAEQDTNESKSRTRLYKLQYKNYKWQNRLAKQEWENNKELFSWTRTSKMVETLNGVGKFLLTMSDIGVNSSEINRNNAQANLSNQQAEGQRLDNENFASEQAITKLGAFVDKLDTITDMPDDMRQILIAGYIKTLWSSPRAQYDMFKDLTDGFFQLGQDGKLKEKTFSQQMQIWQELLNTLATGTHSAKEISDIIRDWLSPGEESLYDKYHKGYRKSLTK